MNQAPPGRYDPGRLLAALRNRLAVNSDAALARALGVEPATISKIRHQRLAVGATMLLRMHEVSALDIEELRALMGDRRARTRPLIKPRRPPQTP
ncbi:hypothetical protein GTP56_17475 [Duganella sp. FT134W]|uniref:XRE family transcriptional regulator n=1 Tax=Duganella margarita TaxID=2692170 RepID=A0A7X4H271_9BURK|nr:hypothetical protein [Duganella margarita]MYM73977.1 hypothetical protein [Duganella margarita]